jgi:hypothetical protein
MPSRIFYVPVLLCIEADNHLIAATEGVEIAKHIADSTADRHLRKDVIVPTLADPLPDRYTCPSERYLHRGIRA